LRQCVNILLKKEASMTPGLSKHLEVKGIRAKMPRITGWYEKALPYPLEREITPDPDLRMNRVGQPSPRETAPPNRTVVKDFHEVRYLFSRGGLAPQRVSLTAKETINRPQSKGMSSASLKRKNEKETTQHYPLPEGCRAKRRPRTGNRPITYWETETHGTSISSKNGSATKVILFRRL